MNLRHLLLAAAALTLAACSTPGAAKAKPAAAEVKPAAAKAKPAAAKVKPAAAEVKPAAAEVKPAAAEVKPGAGKHIVLLAGDEEYRSEEALPALGRILQRQGFKCSVCFSAEEDGSINPDKGDSLTNPAALDSADAIIMLLRFRRWNEETLARFDAAMKRGIPVIALRTSTHAFAGIPAESAYAAWNWNKDGGWGKKVLGESWVSHWGRHKHEATRGVVEAANAGHAILSGVKDVFGTTDVYEAAPPADATVLMRGQVLAGMTPDSPPLDTRKATKDKLEQGINDPMMPIAWTRVVKNEAGGENKIFCTTMGAATDITNEGLRRMIVNAVHWGLGTEAPAEMDLSLPEGYEPTTYGFKGYRKDLKVADHELGR
ncbi:MAG TPA: hypothetical protein DIT64_09960 [Verrucomicrobiales bacterium]|mgnify:CR=1 FL=1|nr:hypothetical protein [Verrucomicrobiales bacterium]